MADQKAAVWFQNVYVMGADADHDLLVVVFGLGGVKVPAIKADLSISVGLAGFIPAYIERFRRKREEMLLIFFKEL